MNIRLGIRISSGQKVRWADRVCEMGERRSRFQDHRQWRNVLLSTGLGWTSSCLALKGPEGEKLFHKEILIVERSFSSRHWDQGVLLPDESLTALILLHWRFGPAASWFCVNVSRLIHSPGFSFSSVGTNAKSSRYVERAELSRAHSLSNFIFLSLQFTWPWWISCWCLLAWSLW